jgi:hypothetical protein
VTAPAGARLRIEAGMFIGIAVFVVLAAVVYGVASEEYAGATLLLLAGVASLVMGGYLVWEQRQEAPAPGGPGAEHQYLPEASIWPFGIGMGAVLMLNGLALGAWAVLPGAAITALSTFGFARQSRQRS